MLKRSLVAVAVVALLAMTVQAGEIKTHTWPCDFKALEITSIPVLMDIGYYIKIKDQDTLKIKLIQDTLINTKFSGCTNMKIESNFAFTISCSITKTGAIDGTYTCAITGGGVGIPAGSNTVEVCATLVNAVLGVSGVPAGSTNVQVATVKISVKPA
jgi:hypothetical protein